MKARCSAILIGVLLIATSAQAQNLLKQRADTLAAKVEMIREAKQEILAPSLLEDVEKGIERARSDIEKGKNPRKIVSTLDEADQTMSQAIGVIRKGLEVFRPVLNARDDALYAKAPDFAQDKWKDAEKDFGDAVSDLEKGKDDKAKEQVTALTALYRDAEFTAIRAQLVVPTLQSLEETEHSDVSKYAPQTLKRSRAHIAQAEIILSRDRYNQDAAMAEVNQAAYEIRHAKYLTELAQQAETKDREGVEALMLNIEDDFNAVADAIGYEAKYDSGLVVPTREVAFQLRNAVSGAGEENKNLRTQLKAQKSVADSIRAEHRVLVDSLETLGGLYQTQLENGEQDRIQREQREQKVSAVLDMFSPEEAAVQVAGEDLVLVPVALQFTGGGTAVYPEQNPVLVKVANAIKQFPLHLAYLSSPLLPADATPDQIGLNRKQIRALQDFLRSQKAFVVTESDLKMEKPAPSAAPPAEEPQATAPESEPSAEAAPESDTTGVSAGAADTSVAVEETPATTAAPATETVIAALYPIRVVVTKALVF